MAEVNRVACRKCGQPLTSEQSDGWCSRCYPDPHSTIRPSEGLQSTAESLPGNWDDTDSAPEFGIDDYQLIRRLGRGGMGMVFLARHVSAGRLVALKVILSERLIDLPDHRKSKAVERFINESRAAAQLNHENIVTVFDVGECSGRHYYTMRYVEGESLSSMLKNGPLGNRQAARYLEAIARAIHEAHRAGVLHRDLKPANVLVDKVNDRPMVADFGLAKLLSDKTEMTMTGEIFGSPPYMSPEQARSAGDVTVLADVYSLGATLYHLLTGRPPFQAASSVETLKQVIHDNPVSPRIVNPAVDVDLETIVLKCLNKDPERRYPSALAISDDLLAFLEGRTISARPTSAWERLARWRRRNTAIALWMTVAAILLVVGTVLSSTLAIMESAQRGEAEFNASVANEKKILAQKNQARAVILAANLSNSLAEVEKQRKQARREAFTSSISASFAYLQNAEPDRIGDRLQRLQLSDAEIREAGFEFHYLHRQAHLRPRLIPSHTASAEVVAFSRDGKVLASGGEDLVTELWNSESGEHLRTLYAAPFPVTALAFSPDRTHLVCGTRNTRSNTHETRVDVWGYETGKLITTLPHHGSLQRLVFSHDGQWLITATADRDQLGELRIYRTSDWVLVKKLEGHKPGNPGHMWGIADVAVLWDNKQVASAGFEGKVRLWDIDAGVEIKTLSGHSGWVRSVAFDSTGKSVVSGSDDQTIRFWDTQNGQQTRIFRDGAGITTAMAFDLQYRSLMTASQLGLLKWDLQSAQAVSLGGFRVLTSLGFSPDGKSLAVARADGMLEIWDYEAAGKFLQMQHPGWTGSVAFSDDGRKLATGSGRKCISVFDMQTRQLLFEIPDQPAAVTTVWFSPNGQYLVSRFQNPSRNRTELRLWDAQTGDPLSHVADEEDIGIDHIAFSENGDLAAVERHHLQHRQQSVQPGGGYIEVWDLESRQRVSRIAARNAEEVSFQSFCFSSDGRHLLANSFDALDRYDVATGQLHDSVPLGQVTQSLQADANHQLFLTTVPDRTDQFALKKLDTSAIAIEDLGTVPYGEFLAISRDGRWLAMRDRQQFANQLTIWDCQNRCHHDMVKSHQQRITDAVFTSNSKTLITVSFDKTIRFRDVESQQELGILRGHTQPIYSVDLTRDENWLVTGAGDSFYGVGSGKPGELYLWNASSATVVAKPGEPEGLETKRWEIQNREIHSNVLETSGDGRLLAFTLPDRHPEIDNTASTTVEIRDLQNGKAVDSFSPFRGVAHICLSHDGRKVAAARRLVHRRTFVEKDGVRTELPPIQDSQTVVVHETETRAKDFSFDVSFREAHALCFSKDGSAILVAGSDGNFEFWNVPDGKRVREGKLHLDRIEAAAISPNGRWAAFGGEILNSPAESQTGLENLVVVDLTNGTEVVRLNADSFMVTDIQFSGNGSLLAASSGYRARRSGDQRSRRIAVWNTSDWGAVTDLNIEPSSMARLTFSTDDRFLTAGASQSSHAVFNVETGQWRIFSNSDRAVWRFAAVAFGDGTMELLDLNDNMLTAKTSRGLLHHTNSK